MSMHNPVSGPAVGFTASLLRYRIISSRTNPTGATQRRRGRETQRSRQEPTEGRDVS